MAPQRPSLGNVPDSIVLGDNARVRFMAQSFSTSLAAWACGKQLDAI